jgi:hypothetical protein
MMLVLVLEPHGVSLGTKNNGVYEKWTTDAFARYQVWAARNYTYLSWTVYKVAKGNDVCAIAMVQQVQEDTKQDTVPPEIT